MVLIRKKIESPIEVNERGKAYVALKNLAVVTLPKVEEPVFVFRYDDRNYISADQAAHICKHPATSMRAIATAHKLGRAFITDAHITFHEHGEKARREQLPTLRRRLFLDLHLFATYCQVGRWCPDIFEHYNAGRHQSWDALCINAVSALEPKTPDWRDKAFCTPDDNFIGLKPGNYLSGTERVRYVRKGQLEGQIQHKATRSDKIILPHELVDLDNVKFDLKQNELVIEFPKGTGIVVKGNKLSLTFGHE